MRKTTIAALIIIVLLFGCLQGNARLGLKTKADCQDPKLRQTEKIPCYHEAAIAASYYLPADTAEGLCNDIWNDIGAANRDNDIGKRAETDRNLCYYDIAKIIARHDGGEAEANSICNNIEQNEYGTKIVGAPVSQKMCLEEVQKIARIRPEKYYGETDDNICTVLFIMPLVLAAALIVRD